MPAEVKVSRSFHYPETHKRPDQRMCSAGQRRAVAEGWNLLIPDGGEIGRRKTAERAELARYRLAHRADVNKHALISGVVMEIFQTGVLEQYVDAQGNYLLETHSGASYVRNLFEDLTSGRPIF